MSWIFLRRFEQVNQILPNGGWMVIYYVTRRPNVILVGEAQPILNEYESKLDIKFSPGLGMKHEKKHVWKTTTYSLGLLIPSLKLTGKSPWKMDSVGILSRFLFGMTVFFQVQTCWFFHRSGKPFRQSKTPILFQPPGTLQWGLLLINPRYRHLARKTSTSIQQRKNHGCLIMGKLGNFPGKFSHKKPW